MQKYVLQNRKKKNYVRGTPPSDHGLFWIEQVLPTGYRVSQGGGGGGRSACR